MRLRIGTWNIKGGRGAKGYPLIRNRTRYLDRIAEIIARKDLQAIVLQEVDVRSWLVGRVHQPQYLADKLTALTGKRWAYLFASAKPYWGGSFGNAVLACFPLEKVLQLPLKMDGQKAEDRVFLLARLIVSESEHIGIGSFHLSYRSEFLRNWEVEKIKISLKDLNSLSRLILGGDLNTRRESEAFRKMLGDHIPLDDLGPVEGVSFTSDKGCEARIDFLFGCGVKPVASGIVDSSGNSDHHLVWAECKL